LRCDICIVGAGIAGSSLAYHLAPEFRVCVVEERGLEGVGRKPCPGAVERSWFRGLSPEDFGAVGRRVRGMRLSVGGWSLRLGFSGYVLNRHRLCRGLLEAALAEGCGWVEGRAEPGFAEGGLRCIRAGGERIEAEVYVDASGAPAVLRRHFLPNRPEMFVSGCMETVEGEQGDGELEVYLLNHRETGWVFPAEHSTNVGYVTGVARKDLHGRLRSFKRGVGLDGAKVLERGQGLIPSYRPIRLVHGNVVAIGDAGFTVNPITCGGIGPSVFAAGLLAESLRRGEGLGAFEARYRELLGKKFEKFHHLNRILRRGWLPLRFAVEAYYSGGALGRLVRRLLAL
jgi:flavin-dependent dehydrogenase